MEDKITEKLGKIPAWIKLLEPVENISAYYDEAAAFLSPSREEGFCYSAVEAAWCKCPVIASDISGQNGINIRGIIWCKSESPSDLADKIDEFLRLTEEEKRKIISLVVTKVNGRIPIVLGVGGNCTRTIVEKLKNDNFDGIDAILSVVPYYNKPSQEGIYQHYKAIAGATKLPHRII